MSCGFTRSVGSTEGYDKFQILWVHIPNIIAPVSCTSNLPHNDIPAPPNYPLDTRRTCKDRKALNSGTSEGTGRLAKLVEVYLDHRTHSESSFLEGLFLEVLFISQDRSMLASFFGVSHFWNPHTDSRTGVWNQNLQDRGN